MPSKVHANGRKRKDMVDRMLVLELRQEEPGWVNYDDDVVDIKNSVTDTLIDILIADTVRALCQCQVSRRGLL